MKKLILLVFVLCILSSCVNEEDYITKEHKLAIFKHGYFRGQKNVLTTSTTEEATAQWKKDSTEFIKLITH